MKTNPDLCIIGAGAVGCSIAYYATLKGLKVLVLDPSGIGQEASSVAAGILSALDESEQTYPISTARLQSLKLFPELTRSLKVQSGIDVGYRPHLLLFLRSHTASFSVSFLSETARPSQQRQRTLHQGGELSIDLTA
jgi:glycine/D-amino acid oxidase-like deaminating enzyme